MQRANTKNILQIGKETTRGLGAGADESIGEKAALESEEEIKNLLKDTDMVFLTAGMGGGTGTGAIPVVARIAKEMGILTIGIVTKPFSFEGKKRTSRAEVGIEKLRQNVDALIVVLNNNLLNVDRNITIENAFELADGILKQGIESITDLITSVGEINIDFADVKTIFNYHGKGYMDIGRAKGNNRVIDALTQAIENPLTENKIDKAKGIIFNITGGENLALSEVYEATNLINDKIDSNASILFGTVLDKDLEDEVSLTVIATGIE